MKNIFIVFSALLALSAFSPAAQAAPKCPPGYIYGPSGMGGMGKSCVRYVSSVARFLHKMKCPKGTFHDPRNGGECWICPAGYARSIHPVTSNKACAKPTGFLKYDHKKATLRKKVACKSPAFVDPRNGGECWVCPKNYARSTSPVNSNKACSNVLYTKPIR
ncbi:MAG: hypothetical protein H6727_11100 [Myxococcales bacterium]|nr:hypothetical protein [Myxococcales bacterium]